MKQENKNGKTFINLKPQDNEQWFISCGVDIGNNPYILLMDSVTYPDSVQTISIVGAFNMKLQDNKLIISNNGIYAELSELNCVNDITTTNTFTSARDIQTYIYGVLSIIS